MNSKSILINASFLLPVFTIGASLTAARSQAPQWVTHGPSGGEVLSLVGTDAGVLYAGTSHTIFASRDGGVNWVQDTSGVEGSPVNGLAIDAAGNVIAATSSGLLRKPANGTAWKAVGTPGFYSSVVAGADGIFFAGTYRSGVAESTDHGATWTAYPLSATNSPAVLKLAADGSGNTYAGTRQGVFVHTAADPASRWNKYPLSAQGSDVSALGVAMDTTGKPAGNATVYAGTGSGVVYSSTDQGQTWTTVSTIAFSEPVSTVVATADGTVYMGNAEGVWTLNKDSGTWSPAAQYNWSAANSLAMIGKKLFAATGNGVLLMGDNGWSIQSAGILAHSVKAIVFGPNNTVVAVTRGGIYRSLDNGETWKFAGFTHAVLECAATAPDGTMYIGTRSEGNPTGILRSPAPDQPFKTALATNLPNASVYGLAVDPDGNVYAATQNGLWKSTDKGETFSEMDKGPGPEAFSSVIALPDGTLFTCSRDGIFRSTDKAATWATVNNGLKVPHAETLAAAPDGSAVYACSGSNIYQSTDKGDNWQFRSETPNGSPGPMRFAAVANNKVYGADANTGAWVSTDGGATWTQILRTPTALTIAIAPGGALFAGTNGASVLQTQQ